MEKEMMLATNRIITNNKENKGYPNTRDQQAGYELYKLFS